MKMIAHLLTFTTILSLGLMAGFFYAFSVTGMPGLDLTAPPVAVEAMQGINTAVRNPVFFVTFFLSPVFAVLAAGALAICGNRLAGWLMGLAGVTYLVGGLILTMTVNVPMNEALATLPPEAATPADWAAYSARWTFWNTMRTAVSMAALLLAAAALVVQPATGTRSA